MNITKKSAYILIVSMLFCAVATAEEVEVQPTDEELGYMERLDTYMGETAGGNDSVSARVIETETGERKIQMDYSESTGSEITGTRAETPE
ncbi:hypothetical protein [Pseudomonas sp. AM4(2022)]|uniref:hypothetical protein n=1 Tax=Pseudomonas sp. AM4(2022) TaxID=2983408 RepID=UPI002E815345|nr:hypothetical protein [Pseudomonas sp. AM4(2022)]